MNTADGKTDLERFTETTNPAHYTRCETEKDGSISILAHAGSVQRLKFNKEGKRIV